MKIPKSEYELHILGTYVHGVLSAFHTLGIVYNYRKGNKMDVLIHSLALGYDTYSVWKHYKTMSRLENIVRAKNHENTG